MKKKITFWMLLLNIPLIFFQKICSDHNNFHIFLPLIFWQIIWELWLLGLLQLQRVSFLLPSPNISWFWTSLLNLFLPFLPEQQFWFPKPNNLNIGSLMKNDHLTELAIGNHIPSKNMYLQERKQNKTGSNLTGKTAVDKEHSCHPKVIMSPWTKGIVTVHFWLQ